MEESCTYYLAKAKDHPTSPDTVSSTTNEVALSDKKNTRTRVKLWVLNEKRVWDDRGTGHVICVSSDRFGGMALFVFDENEDALLLEAKIRVESIYQKQQDTLIVWSEGDACDLALSFQEKLGCDDIWEKISQVQGKSGAAKANSGNNGTTSGNTGVGGSAAGSAIASNSEGGSLMEVDSDSESVESGGMPVRTMSPSTTIALPACEISKLQEILDQFNLYAQTPMRREQLALFLESEGYIRKLLNVFRICEDLENIDSLHLLYQIFKIIFLLNKNAIFELLFSDENLQDVVGLLEYDPTAKSVVKHREFLWNIAKFHQVIPNMSADLQAKIHQTFRVQYIQDVIFPAPSVFEENILSCLNSFIFFNKVEIVSLIQDDEQFLTELFSQLSDESISNNARRNLALFLKEFCVFSQVLQPQGREVFFRTISSHGILQAIDTCLAGDDLQTRMAAVEIFTNVVEYSPGMVREYMLQQSHTQAEDDALFMNLIIEKMFDDPDRELGCAVQLMGILRVLIDPENMMATPHNKTEFLTFFYRRCMSKLCAPLLANTTTSEPSKDNYQTAHLLSLVLEILTFCIQHHTYHIRNYTINKDLLKRVLVLLRSHHAFLVLGALRFLRHMVGLKDEFYNRHIIKGRLFGPVAQCFQANGHKYNLINSAILELFEYIRSEDIHSLCSYFAENHYAPFKDVDYVLTFKTLKLRYDQKQEKAASGRNSSDGFRSPAATPPLNSPLAGPGPPSPGPGAVFGSRFRRDARQLDEDEEAYFNEDEEEEWEFDDMEQPSSTVAGGSLAASRFSRALGSPTRSVGSKSPSLFDSPAQASSFDAGNNLPDSSSRPDSSPISSKDFSNRQQMRQIPITFKVKLKAEKEKEEMMKWVSELEADSMPSQSDENVSPLGKRGVPDGSDSDSDKTPELGHDADSAGAGEIPHFGLSATGSGIPPVIDRELFSANQNPVSTSKIDEAAGALSCQICPNVVGDSSVSNSVLEPSVNSPLVKSDDAVTGDDSTPTSANATTASAVFDVLTNGLVSSVANIDADAVPDLAPSPPEPTFSPPSPETEGPCISQRSPAVYPCNNNVPPLELSGVIDSIESSPSPEGVCGDAKMTDRRPAKHSLSGPVGGPPSKTSRPSVSRPPLSRLSGTTSPVLSLLAKKGGLVDYDFEDSDTDEEMPDVEPS